MPQTNGDYMYVSSFSQLPDADDYASPTVEEKEQLVTAGDHSGERRISSSAIPLRSMPPRVDNDIEVLLESDSNQATIVWSTCS